MKTVEVSTINFQQLHELAVQYPAETLYGLASLWMAICIWLVCRS